MPIELLQISPLLSQPHIFSLSLFQHHFQYGYELCVASQVAYHGIVYYLVDYLRIAQTGGHTLGEVQKTRLGVTRRI